MALVPAIEGDNYLFNFYFADTICGLIEYLDDQDIGLKEAERYWASIKKKKYIRPCRSGILFL
jgi:hypothetical protein